ncbi:hypothetical protein EOM82_08485 [bacterium]|nr:hypothetical protein [bacterium]
MLCEMFREYLDKEKIMAKKCIKCGGELNLTDVMGGAATSYNATNRIKKGATLNAPTNPNKEGYTFKGWYTSEYGYWDSEPSFNFDKKIWETNNGICQLAKQHSIRCNGRCVR